MKQKIVDTVFDNWCDKEFSSEIIAAMDNAVKNPNKDTIFQLVSITEASAFKGGFYHDEHGSKHCSKYSGNKKILQGNRYLCRTLRIRYRQRKTLCRP